MVKFEHEDQKIVVHGEDEQSIYRDPSVLCLEDKEGSEHIVYQDFEIMVADQCEEGTLCPQTFLSNASIMVASEMIRHGYKLEKRLDASLQGITEPITLTTSKYFFGVGFQATEVDVKWDKERKNDGWVLPHPVSHIARTFLKPRYIEEEAEAFTAEEIEDICGAMRQMLYEAYMVQPGEGSSTAEVQYMGPNTKLQNWKATLFPVRQESWVMPFGLKNAGETYMRVMIVIFHDMLHQEIEVYVDDVIIKSRMRDDHVQDLRKFFEHLRKYDLKLNPAKCAFGVPSGKLLGFVPLSTYFPDEEVNSVEVIPEDINSWKMFFDGAVNAKGVGIGEIFISPTGQHYPTIAQLRFFCMNNTSEYEACIMGMNMAIDQDMEELLIMGDSDMIIRRAQGEWETRDVKLLPYRQHVEDLSKRFKSVEFMYIPWFHNELADALATLASMLPYPGNVHIDPLEIQIPERHGYFNTVEVEPDVRPWYHDIKRFLKTKEYPEQASGDQKRTIRRLASGFFLSGEVLYKRTLDVNLLRCVDAQEAKRIMNKVHAGVCGPHMNGYVLAKKILRAEVEIPSLRIIVETEIEDSEWVKIHLEQLTLIDEKRMVAICHEQLYQQRMARAYNKKVWPRNFEMGKLILRCILLHHKEAK
ncbi:uncharacterized protein [Nicotiana sylvestris]|uniref:uncharacterized protein n=1 Tax=Nicotiana sylvestris TaxID=4096 RepID=UPI00388CC170